MKATLQFLLPEEKEEFKYAQDGVYYSIAIDEFDNFLRSKLKYEELSEAEHEIYQTIRTKFNDIVRESLQR